MCFCWGRDANSIGILTELAVQLWMETHWPSHWRWRHGWAVLLDWVSSPVDIRGDCTSSRRGTRDSTWGPRRVRPAGRPPERRPPGPKRSLCATNWTGSLHCSRNETENPNKFNSNPKVDPFAITYRHRHHVAEYRRIGATVRHVMIVTGTSGIGHGCRHMMVIYGNTSKAHLSLNSQCIVKCISSQAFLLS